MDTLSLRFPIKILPDDIDFMGHVNNSRYLNWVQDAVLAHWRGSLDKLNTVLKQLLSLTNFNLTLY